MKKFLSIILLTLCFLIVFTPLAHAYDPDDPSTYYIANSETGKFHLPSCSYLPEYGNRYLVDRNNTSKLDSLSPCGHCDPLSNDYYSPKNPDEKPGSSGSSNSNSSNNSHNSSNSSSHADYYNFTEVYFDVTAYIFAAIMILSALWMIFSWITNFFDHSYVIEKISEIWVSIIMYSFIIDIFAMIIGKIVFFIIELFI